MTLEELFKEFKKKKIVVLGDVMIDAYMWGSVKRVSPEAPVPIVNLTKQEDRLGGAANVVLNLVSLGAEVTIASVVGDDKEATTLLELLEKDKILTTGVLQSKDRITTVKTRVLGNYQQLLRIDQEQTDDIHSADENRLLKNVEKLFQKEQEAIIQQDYIKEEPTESLIIQIIDLTKKYKVIIREVNKQKKFI